MKEYSDVPIKILKPPPFAKSYNLDVGFYKAYSLAVTKRGEANKTTEYWYLLEWKAFWIMRRYFKHNFDSMFKYKPWMTELTHEDMDSMLLSFLKVELKHFP